MTDIQETKLALQQRLRELQDRIEDIDEDLSSPADDDWDEAAVEAAGDEVLEEVGDVSLDEMAQIRKALALIEAGRYGECESCGESIGDARLRIIPSATKCVNCA